MSVTLLAQVHTQKKKLGKLGIRGFNDEAYGYIKGGKVMSICKSDERYFLRKVGSVLGREGMSKRVIELVKNFDGSYLGAIKLAGSLKAVAIMAESDSYWHEKMQEGYLNEIARGYAYIREE